MKIELTDRQKEVFCELTSDLTREKIIEKAARDGEKPMGFLLTYIRDRYNMPKSEGWNVAESLLHFFNIDNENPWKKLY
jgi:hypothetical protein